MSPTMPLLGRSFVISMLGLGMHMVYLKCEVSTFTLKATQTTLEAKC